MVLQHGTILGGTATVPDLSRAVSAYQRHLGLDVIEQGLVSAELAQSWGCPGNTGSPYALLSPASPTPFALRLVEQPARADFVPTTSFGWAAFELSVEDVFGLAGELANSDFTILGPPRHIANMEPAFIPMQVLGPGGEMIYLNQVLKDMPTLDLPKARARVDAAFIMVLAARDREATIGWYVDMLGLDRSDSMTIPYTMINKAFGLPADYLTTITMLAKARMPIIEVDDYPAAAQDRPAHAGQLPPGNAMVSLGVESLDACPVGWIVPPRLREGAFYNGRRSATTAGPSGELIELIEIVPG